MLHAPDTRTPLRLVHITTVVDSLTFLRGQFGYMQARGFDIHVITSPDDRLAPTAAREGITAHGVEMPRRITPFRDLLTVVRLAALLREIRPHIVHAHTPKGGLLGMLAARLAGVPVCIYHMRGLPLMTATGTKRRLLTLTERVSCRLAQRVFCVSHSLRRVAIEAKLCPEAKIVTFLGGSGNGVDAERFNPHAFPRSARAELRARYNIPDDALVLGYVGRIVRDKGWCELAEAWQQLRQMYPNLYLLACGRFEPQDPLPDDLVARLRQDDRIRFTGSLDDIVSYYTAMDLVCLPTYREGFPNVLLEAAAMALPVVSTQVAGCVDAVAEGVTGMLVPAADAPALTKALQRYLDDPALRATHGYAGRDRVVRDFGQQAIWEAIYQEYRALLAVQRQPIPGDVADEHQPLSEFLLRR